MPATAVKPSKFERDVQKIVDLLMDPHAEELGLALDLNNLIYQNDGPDAQVIREALTRTKLLGFAKEPK